MVDAHGNFGYGEILVAPVPPDTGLTFTLKPGHGARFATPPWNGTIGAAKGSPNLLVTTSEIVRVASIVGDVVTLATRAVEGPNPPRTIVQGDTFRDTITAGFMDEIINARSAVWFDVHDYGAVGDGVTDDTTAVLAAYAAAEAAGGGTVLFRTPSIYLMSAPIVGSYGTAYPQPAPSLVALTAGGHIGDTSYPTERGVCELVASGTFPVGTFMIDYQQNVGNGGPSGAWIKGLTLSCQSRAAGFRAQGPRLFHIEDVAIINAAAPSGSYTDGSDGAFNISFIAGHSTSGAWNRYDNLTIENAAHQGIWHNGPNLDIFVNTHVQNSGQANILLNTSSICSFYGGDQSSVGQTIGWDIIGWTGTVIGFHTEINGNGGNAMKLRGGSNMATVPTLQQFIACGFMNHNAFGAEGGAVLAFDYTPGRPHNVEFTDCEIIADGTGTSYYVFIATSSIGTVDFKGCNFHGVPITANYIDNSTTGVLKIDNSLGINPVGVVTVTVPGSGTAVAPAAYRRTFYVTNGAATNTFLIEGGPTITLLSGVFATIQLPARKKLTPTYTSAPTWVVEGE